MKNTYHIPHFFAHSEEDNFEQGCIGPANSYTYEQSFDASSEQHLLELIMVHFDVERDALELNACEEDGRIDVARMECEDGTKAYESDIAAWKAGNKKLFYTVYTGQLEIKTPAKFNL